MSAVKGIVEDCNTGQKLEGIRVECKRWFYGSQVWSGDTFTDSNGYYKFDNLADYTEHSVKAFGGGTYADSKEVHFTTGFAWSETPHNFYLLKIIPETGETEPAIYTATTEETLTEFWNEYWLYVIILIVMVIMGYLIFIRWKVI